MDWTVGLDWFIYFYIFDLHVSHHVRWYGAGEYFITGRYTMSCLFCDFISEHCLVCTYVHTKLYLNHASLNNRWKAGFHEGREITYSQEINYLQKCNKKNTGDFNCTIIHTQASFNSFFVFISIWKSLRIQQFLPHGEYYSNARHHYNWNTSHRGPINCLSQ
jgi:hypothetical protein